MYLKISIGGLILLALITLFSLKKLEPMKKPELKTDFAPKGSTPKPCPQGQTLRDSKCEPLLITSNGETEAEEAEEDLVEMAEKKRIEAEETEKKRIEAEDLEECKRRKDQQTKNTWTLSKEQCESFDGKFIGINKQLEDGTWFMTDECRNIRDREGRKLLCVKNVGRWDTSQQFPMCRKSYKKCGNTSIELQV